MLRGLRERSRRDLERGITGGRFNVADTDAAFFATTGALILIMRAVLDGDLSGQADQTHAEAVLRILGLSPRDAAEVSHRPLRPWQQPTDHA
jgi:hypothetical protein